MLNIVKLTAEQKSFSLKEIGYTEKSLEEDLERLKLWIKTQPHLPSQVYEEPDAFLKTFIVGCKGKMDVAKRKLDAYYTARSKMSYVFQQMDPLSDRLLVAQHEWFTGLLPKPTPEGCRVYFAIYSNPDPEIYHPEECSKRFFMILEQYWRMEAESSGTFVFADLQSFSLKHFAKISPVLLMDFIEYVQDRIPVRVKGIIFINVPSYLETLFNTVIKPLLSNKLAKRAHIYADEKKLFNHFSKDIIPIDYGGNETSVRELSDAFLEEFKSRRQWALTHLSVTCDETKRKDKIDTDWGGGTFRQLTVD